VEKTVVHPRASAGTRRRKSRSQGRRRSGGGEGELRFSLLCAGVFAVVVVTRRVEVGSSNGFSGGGRGGASHSWLPCYCRCARFVGVFIFFSLYSSSRTF